ncbi:MAG TPA: BamA/TamA family outer membrane protein [Chitinispirillaceae bacterium]|nr:BamA/TamA family outer membrane protein [Chitinispirillaceae bacterium]
MLTPMNIPVKGFLLSIILICCSNSWGFGKNKVQYENLKWKVISTPHFEIYHHQEKGDLAQISQKFIENAYKKLQKQFGFDRKERLPLVIYGTPDLFSQTNIITVLLSEDVGGFTELFKTRIAIPFNGSYNELRHVLHHELSHAFVLGILYDQKGGNLLFNRVQVPFWFMEGSAEFLSSGWDIEADMFMMDQTINSFVPLPGPALDGYLAYKGGQSFLFFLSSSRGQEAFGKFLREFRRTRSVENSIKKIYGKPVEELGKEWIQELKRIYWPEIGRRISPSRNAIAITSHLETRDHYNLHPRISPDGSKIAFFSDRKDFTNILITDRKGKVLQRISQNGYGGYFESFHPFRSGMCWSPDGSKLAFVTKSGGRDEIRIVEVNEKKLLKKISASATSLSDPDWSRCGKKIAFSGITNDGKSDLFIYDFEKDSISRLTNNIQQESDPRFSPDGKKLLFSLQDTCGSAQTTTTAFKEAPCELAEIDLLTGKQKILTSTPWNEIQPCYSPDGDKIAFISDRNGINNIYIAPLDSLSEAKPLTDYIGGCSNPDWSREGDIIVFSLFQQQGWDIWSIEKPLSKLRNDTLACTRFVEATYSSTPLFTPVELKPDSSKNGITEISASKENSDSSAIIPDTLNMIESSAVSVNGKDSAVEDSSNTEELANLLSTPPADSVSQDSSAVSLNSSDSTATDSLNTVEPVNLLSTPSADSSSRDSTTAAVSSPKLPSRPYRLKFTPDLVTLGVGVSTYYSPAGQWLLAFSDMMGDHRITVAGDIQGNFNDYIHLFASYYYLRNRLDIGLGAFLSKDYSNASIFGDHLYHDTEAGGFLVLQYPFSISSRVDLEIFACHIKRKPVGFSGPNIKTSAFLPTLSYVFDNILWGLTGPLNGTRAAAGIIVSPPLNFVDDPFISIDADIRNYLHLAKRFVWANRLFLGASFGINEKQSARRYMLGGNENWLLYRVNLDQYEKNLPGAFYSSFVTPFRGWNYIDLSGTKVAVLNSEFRFPFIREISLVWPLPIQIRYINGAVFTDIGNAWDTGDQVNGLPFPDKIYGGFGFGLRANLGIFVLRFDRGWPTDWKSDIGTPINYFSLGAEF